MKIKRSFISVQEKYDYWANLIRECQNSGLNTTKWCSQNNVPRRSFYNHYNEIKQRCYDEYRDIFETKTTTQNTNIPRVKNKVRNGDLTTKKAADKLIIQMNDVSITVPLKTNIRRLNKILRAIKDVC